MLTELDWLAASPWREPRRQGPAWQRDEIQERHRICWFALWALVSGSAAFALTGLPKTQGIAAVSFRSHRSPDESSVPQG